MSGQVMFKPGLSDFQIPPFSSCLHELNLHTYTPVYMHVHVTSVFLNTALVTKQWGWISSVLYFSVLYNLLRLIGFPLFRVASNVVFIRLCLCVIEERRKRGRAEAEGDHLSWFCCLLGMVCFLLLLGGGECHCLPPCTTNCGNSQISFR